VEVGHRVMRWFRIQSFREVLFHLVENL
jgi:hypothetical protein